MQPVFELQDTPIGLVDLVLLIALLILVLVLVGRLKRFLKNYLLPVFGLNEGNRHAIAILISYSFGAFTMVLIVNAYGVDLQSLALVAGGLGVGIGFGLQNITSNFISGLILLAERKIQAGDFVVFNDMSGYIKEMTLRSTLIKTLDGGDVIIPNGQLVDSNVLNWAIDGRQGRMRIPVGVAYGSDPVLVTELLLECAYKQPSVLKQPTPRVVFTEFGDSSLNFELFVWIEDMERGIFVKSDLNYLIEYTLRSNGIAIPFPQRDLWLRNPEDLGWAFRPELIRPATVRPKAPGTKPTQLEESEELTNPNETLKPHQRLKDLLSSMDCFRGLDEIELRYLIEAGHREYHKPETIIAREGEVGQALYILLSGQIEGFTTANGKEHPVRVFMPGEFFGEVPLVLGVPNPITTRVLEPTSLFVICRPAFEKLLQSNPTIANSILLEMGKMQEKLAALRKKLYDMGLLDENDTEPNPLVWVRNRLKTLFNLD
jgi:small-conductance mechanosensitive channel/CRP-like cAMP-binding protein